jgi:hypothetical protein
MPPTVVVSLTANGVSLGERTERLEIRTVNDVPTRIVDKDGKIGYRFRLSFGDSGAAQSASSFLGSFIRLSATREFGFVVRIVQLSIISLLG